MAVSKKPERTELKPEPKLYRVTTWALVRVGGGISALKVEVEVSSDLSSAEVLKVELGEPDYRAITGSKVSRSLHDKTVTW